MNMKKKIINLLVLFLIMNLILFGCTSINLKKKNHLSQQFHQVEQSDFVLGTYGQIKIYTDSVDKGNDLLSRVFQHIRHIENTMSTSIPASDVYQLNQNAGISPVKVSPETLIVIEQGLYYEKVTKGLFHIGIGSLIELWGIGKDWQRVPSSEEIQEARKHIDLNQLEINGQEIFIKDTGMSIDLGGIAKGYAVDEVVNMLKREGIENGFVNLGGDVYALGLNPDGKPWNIGIKNPQIGANNVVIRIPITNQSIVTSGDYERYFIENGVHYHHIIDPRTGYPSESSLVSVTIISDKALDGDVLSTAVFIMGVEEGLQFIEEMEGIEAIFITNNKEVYCSSGIKNQIEILDTSYTLSETD